MEFSIILPIHNEQINAKKLILEILNLYPDKTYEILAVNDYSNDKTLEMLKEIESEKLSIISHSVNLGQSRAMITGAQSAKSDICVFLDGDGQNDPKYIDNMVNLLKKSSDNIKLIIGERKKRTHTFSKHLQSIFGNWIRNLILDDNCNDSGCGLKVIYKKEFLDLHRLNNMHRFIPYLLKIQGYTRIYFSTLSNC